MEFDIDVSGEDLLSKDYTIVIADHNNLIRGHKFDEKTIFNLVENYNQGKYRYKRSKIGNSLFKIRLYCTIIYYLFNNIFDKIKNKNLILNVCKDFDGRENDIRSNLEYFLVKRLRLRISMRFVRLDDNSNADKYAFLIRHDKNNLMKSYYINISLRDIEKFLIK